MEGLYGVSRRELQAAEEKVSIMVSRELPVSWGSKGHSRVQEPERYAQEGLAGWRSQRDIYREDEERSRVRKVLKRQTLELGVKFDG